MLIPRNNQFKVILPDRAIPQWLIELYTEVIKDAGLSKVYNNNPVNCLAESLVGIHLPGIHLKLAEQEVKDMQDTGFVTRYWPKGTNAMRVLDDNEMALTFRHIDGFINYYMVRAAIDYMSDDNAQSALGEVYKSIGNMQVETRLTDNFTICDQYMDVVYSCIDGNDFAYAGLASESQFTVRCKFTYYYSDTYYKGQCISHRMFNHNQGN